MKIEKILNQISNEENLNFLRENLQISDNVLNKFLYYNNKLIDKHLKIYEIFKSNKSSNICDDILFDWEMRNYLNIKIKNNNNIIECNEAEYINSILNFHFYMYGFNKNKKLVCQIEEN